VRNAYVIELKRDIDNPRPDRRSKSWHNKPTITAGMRFIVQNDQTLLYVNSRYDWCRINDEVGKLVMENSERVEPKLLREIKVVDADHDYDGDGILEAFLKMGKLTRDDFREAREFMEAEYAKEEENKR